jgi:hypothetical protein
MHRRHARRVLGMPEVVVAARDVERDEYPATRFPAYVLAILAVLHFGFQGRVAEERAPALQSLQGLLAIAPLVVAGDQQKRVADARELLFSLPKPFFTACALARADVAYMHHEGEVLGVHFVDDTIEALDLAFGVGHVAQHAEDDRPVRNRRGAGARAQNENEKQPRRRMPFLTGQADGLSARWRLPRPSPA